MKPETLERLNQMARDIGALARDTMHGWRKDCPGQRLAEALILLQGL